MKKLIATLISLILLLTAVAVGVFTLPASAEWYDWDDAVSSGDYTYLVEDEEAIILSANESVSGAVTIPSKLGGYPVTVIAENAFENRDLMTTLTIPDNVVTIEEQAFNNCDNLMVVTIGNGVTYIGTEAFRDCNNMFMLTLGKKVETIDWGAFAYCSELVTLTIPNSVISINDSNWNDIGVFESCSSLEQITLGSKLTHIGSRAFFDCSNVTNITIPDSVTVIGESAFEYCNNLSEIDIPNSVISIGDFAFGMCSGLTKVTIGNEATGIARGTFCNCEKLSSIVIGDNVSYIGGAAFLNCVNLCEITLPDSVEEIRGEEFRCYGEWSEFGAFEGCLALTKIQFSKNLTSIGVDAFNKCQEIKEITLPNSVTTICDRAFEKCINLKKAVIGEGVTAIPNALFNGCEKLSSVKIGSNVVAIEARAFQDCVSLTEIELPDNVVSLYSTSCRLDGKWNSWWYDDVGAFWGCSSLKSVTLGKMVTSISEGTFAHCGKLTNITVKPGNLMFSSADGILYNRKKTTIVYCPAGKAVVGVLPSTVTAVDKNAFTDCANLTEVWFAGSESQRNNIDFSSGNDQLNNATWHYDACIGEHTYAGACDTVCNKCSWSRQTSVNHTYTNACDSVCDLCGATRYVDGHVWAEGACSVCGADSPSKPAITKEPKTGYAQMGNKVSVKVTAEGEGLRYEWYIKNDGAKKYSKSSVTSATYSTTMSDKAKGRRVYCVITDLYGNKVQTKTVLLREAASITKQPATVAYAKKGAKASVKVTAKGDGLKYAWYIKNEGSSKYSKSSVTSATYSATMSSKVKGRRIYCIVTDKYGKTVQSKTFLLRESVSIATQPKTVTVAKNKTAKVTVKASGDGLKSTWYIKNAGSSKYSKSSVKTASYSTKMTSKVKNRQVYCVVTDKYGKTVKTVTVKLKMK